ncbi:hypothetical protein POVWA2_078960 [Plasmodium ovale wallikeri]|uniref:STP1 protein n=1 Tax=Plasmodium ovale wallikeri TaxID=864142 RepID=A0A1A9AL52_PLAOA|nr:hypothetical protein POVWA2_078960 [Plasmodium ovale wallikeri]
MSLYYCSTLRTSEVITLYGLQSSSRCARVLTEVLLNEEGTPTKNKLDTNKKSNFRTPSKDELPYGCSAFYLNKNLSKKRVYDGLSKCGQNKTKKQMYAIFYYYGQNFKKYFKKMKKGLMCTLEKIGEKYKFKSYLKDYECLWNDSVERATDIWTNLMNKIENCDEYEMGEIKDDIFVLNTEKLDNINNKEELYKHDNCLFLIKVLTQIFMMVIEECIKEESPEKTELVLDNIIEKLNKEKHAKIESENIHQENMNHKKYSETLEKDTHKYKDSFKELMESWTNKHDIDINSADDKNTSDKCIEMTGNNFLNTNDDTSENTINYMRKE